MPDLPFDCPVFYSRLREVKAAWSAQQTCTVFYTSVNLGRLLPPSPLPSPIAARQRHNRPGPVTSRNTSAQRARRPPAGCPSRRTVHRSGRPDPKNAVSTASTSATGNTAGCDPAAPSPPLWRMMRKTLSGMRWLWIALQVPVLAWTVPSTPRSPPLPRVSPACLEGTVLCGLRGARLKWKMNSSVVAGKLSHCPHNISKPITVVRDNRTIL